ncbi:dna repair protein [Ophiostoma piceae UAMH 11346]|uniref:Dna repair protein n=1 Tax=Ophiostoma piceae (strain UAMH 11346) TaxID=1262450 RepID=S3C6K5_OPHP1|nr:dna repair protein [Ophiostoma piceae UAMH 11346]
MSSSSSAPQPVKLSLPLEYQQSLFQELRADDELVVLARGLGLMRLVTNLLHSYDAAGNNLVLVVNADERENGWIGEALAEHAAISMASRARGLTVVNTDFTTVGAREKMYAAGGIFSITSRILVVDLLTNLLKPEIVTGIVVLHAERVVATSLEAFILRIYRQKNKVGFLKAFSDNPESFATGFAPLATMMRNLFLRKASLWPRFHVTVANALEGKKRAEVVEFEVPMTDNMREIQNAILECVEVNIQELKRTNSGLLDMEDWNLDSALLKNFDVIVRRQLDPHWHRVSWKTKQIVGDLAVLRGLLQAIVECDAVSFLQRLDTILAAHAPPPGSTRHTQSPWLFLDAAQTIFDTSKRRVYTGKHNLNTDDDDVLDPTISGSNNNNNKSKSTLRPVLEEQPKWSVLAEILEEIDRDLYLESQPRDDSNGTILIMCADTDTCRQLRDFLQVMHMRPRTETRVEEFFDADEDRPSGAFMMRRKLRNYLRWKREFANVNASLFAENQKALSGAIDPRTGRPAGAMRNGVPLNKRRRVRGGATGMAQATNASAIATALTGDGYGGRAANGSVAQYFEKPYEVAELMAEIQAADGASSSGAPGNGDGGDAEISNDAEIAAAQQKAEILAALADPLEDMDDYYQLYEMRDLVVVHAYDGDQDEHVLEEVKPRYIIMYEPDAAFIRRIEVYRSSHNDRGVRTYFMYYSGSVEEQKYLSAVRREKDAFTRLIKERAGMAVTLTATTAAHSNISNADDPQESFLRTVNTRIAGGGRLAATAQQPRVVVDVREFRSSLPSLLHGRNMAVVPCMLTVGDYVLSNNICVERKSVSDLISSFRDGRLFSQCESMFQHYQNPMLLIEFDQNKSFTLEPFADLSSSSSSSYGSANNSAGSSNPNAPDLQSKIVLLTLAFPKLRILWASSPYETAEIFERLKSQEAEPDPVAAVRAGLDPNARADDQPFNLEPQEMLSAVPGVTPQNIRTLIFETESISAIATMEVPDLEPIVGGESARLITKFFKRDVIEDAESSY